MSGLNKLRVSCTSGMNVSAYEVKEIAIRKASSKDTLMTLAVLEVEELQEHELYTSRQENDGYWTCCRRRR